MEATLDATASEARVLVERHTAQGINLDEDRVAEETPVALEYNGISHAVMLASPANLEDFALGFSLSEGILGHVGELYECDVQPGCDGYTISMRIDGARFHRLKDQRRSLTGRTGCGLCGAETLAQAIRRPPPVAGQAAFTLAQIRQGMAAMQAQQYLQQQTGATHGAAWMDADGRIVLVREDVGRHNALDKLIGAMAAQGVPVSDGAALITSRASYEMVQKCATVGIAFLAAISAPTALAIRLAEQTGVTLIGFVRERGHVVYAGGRRPLQQCMEKETA